MAKKISPFEDAVTAVKSAQKKWAEAIVAGDWNGVTKLYAKSGDNWHRDLRSSGDSKCVLAFNPTLDDSFLTTQAEALHYFQGTDEKPGFARKGWIAVLFDPTEHPKAQRFIAPTADGAVAIGRYVFERENAVLDASGQEVLAVVRLAVDYTFVYKVVGGEFVITAHHSSLPLSQKTVK